ncbi:hypothetical protein THJ096_19780 (plasmid) [Campylobacter jejuni]|nr:hypothetical protein THJ096_19780 [Campylobacter jejuni]
MILLYDEEGRIIWALYDDIEKGKLKDPRDIDSTPESRNEFDDAMDGYRNGMKTNFDVDTPNEWSEQQATLVQRYPSIKRQTSSLNSSSRLS